MFSLSYWYSVFVTKFLLFFNAGPEDEESKDYEEIMSFYDSWIFNTDYLVWIFFTGSSWIIEGVQI
jgi:hypothetical protein